MRILLPILFLSVFTLVACELPAENLSLEGAEEVCQNNSALLVRNNRGPQDLVVEISKDGAVVARNHITPYYWGTISLPDVPGNSNVHVVIRENVFQTIAFENDLTTECNSETLLQLEPTVELHTVIETSGRIYNGSGLPGSGVGGSVDSPDLTSSRVWGIYCGTSNNSQSANCTASYYKGTHVMLKAHPNRGYAQNGISYELIGWEGCAPTAEDPSVCIWEANASGQVKAIFGLNQNVTVTVSRSGLNNPSPITSDVGALNCAEGCDTQSIQVPRGTQVTLTATPSPGYKFLFWDSVDPSGPCSGSTQPQCTFTPQKDQTTLYPAFDFE